MRAPKFCVSQDFQSQHVAIEHSLTIAEIQRSDAPRLCGFMRKQNIGFRTVLPINGCERMMTTGATQFMRIYADLCGPKKPAKSCLLPKQPIHRNRPTQRPCFACQDAQSRNSARRPRSQNHTNPHQFVPSARHRNGKFRRKSAKKLSSSTRTTYTNKLKIHIHGSSHTHLDQSVPQTLMHAHVLFPCNPFHIFSILNSSIHLVTSAHRYLLHAIFTPAHSPNPHASQ